MAKIDLKQFEGHTPKPWYLWAQRPNVIGTLNGDIATINANHKDQNQPDANALLTSKSPAILEYAHELEAHAAELEGSLRVLLNELRDWRDNRATSWDAGVDAGICKAWDKSKAALAAWKETQGEEEIS